MFTNILGYPRIGAHRELKKACEKYWKGKITVDELLKVGQEQRAFNWQTQQEQGVDLIPANDFSYYDQVLDTVLAFGVIPERYQPLKALSKTDLYFAMARGYQKGDDDVIAMEMTKWFDTNYHYMVPEFAASQTFALYDDKPVREFLESKALGIHTKPVLLSPVSFLLLGKEKEKGFHRITLLERLLPVYIELLRQLCDAGADWIQIDEPFLVMDLSKEEQKALRTTYETIKKEVPQAKIILTTYFEGLRQNTALACELPACALHIDLARDVNQLGAVLDHLKPDVSLSLGLVDGRNIWKNDFTKSLPMINQAVEKLGQDRVMVATSCSLLHTPCDLDLETNEEVLPQGIKRWLAFAKQKVEEVAVLKKLCQSDTHQSVKQWLTQNMLDIESRQQSELIHKSEVKQRVVAIKPEDYTRDSTFETRQLRQREKLNLPVFPTTTIGSFPQTAEIRKLRQQFKKGQLTQAEYEDLLQQNIEQTIRWQESVGLDVLVHGEYERNDMVEYFGELLEGFVFTKNGWVQSYGSRGVKPPIIFGDVQRSEAMTVRWSSFAQQQTQKLVKGMLTGPVTILQWSFVRDDQPRSVTAQQIALAIRDEVSDLEKAGIQVVQIDEPAIREGLPLRTKDWDVYLKWAVNAFRLASSGVKDETQIHTHMCYSEFNDIIPQIAAMDADVITIETSRSQMELLEAFREFRYPNEIGPGVYDIHSPRVPSTEEMTHLLQKASEFLPAQNIWVNPDCGLKTRDWAETKVALTNLVEAAKKMRETTA
ncbi:5-methyltetrahydropteroyltriglutamate--homocysteine S-methyltransferase [Microscilla marina]|uniref:5-methyltetrahydropteroyltriglutamate--homocysteine methyltransferase n=1 Tax=Microscilla marina ATCC 23134 TaxID=313606 RepID=A1ZP45_MICM2|nr:5-methyltetrahydropteroyltriglutamate--homocysteine S-methyltransferase [Microscilla marina]EAY27837.1 5-methyltetrahydropteroyltriglutamate--homocysteine S-methyltransferase [Microscilla marina ATCC 23134]